MAAPTASPSEAPTIGRYELLGRLAVGGMGEVFLARQVGPHGFDREVVLKTLLPEVAAQPSSVEQFLDEARLAARLNHPNIVSIHEVGSEKGRYYLVMEHIDGPPLSKLLRHLKHEVVTDPHRAAPAAVDARGSRRGGALSGAGWPALRREAAALRAPRIRAPAIAEALFSFTAPIADEDSAAATPLLEVVLALQPDHPLALYRLGMTNLANHRDEGRAQLKRFIQVYTAQDPLRAGALAALKR